MEYTFDYMRLYPRYLLGFILIYFLTINITWAQKIKLWIVDYSDIGQTKYDYYFNKQIEPYLKVNKNIEVIPVQYRTLSTDVLHETYRDLFLNNEVRPDIIIIDIIYISEFVNSEFLLPLGKYFTEQEHNKFLSRTLQAGHYGGKLYAIPHHTDVGVLYYRKDLLQKYSVESPKTWDELIKAAQLIMPKEMIYGYVGQMAKYEGLVCNLLEFFWNTGCQVLKDTSKLEVSLDSKSCLEALKLMRNIIYENKLTPPSQLEIKESDAFKLFHNRKCLFMRNWTTEGIGMFKDKDFIKNVGVSPLPTFSQSHARFSTLGGWYLAINKRTRHPSEAVKLLKFLVGKQSQEFNFKFKSQFPAFKRENISANILRSMPLISEFHKIFAQNARERPAIPFYQELSAILQEEAYKCLKRQIEPAQAIISMKDKIKALIRLYNTEVEKKE